MIDPQISAHYTGDCRTLLRELPDGCVQTCITGTFVPKFMHRAKN